MIRKFLKWSLKILLGILLLIALLYGGFHLWEYASGGKYVKFLSENSETIPLDESFAFETLGGDIDTKQLILVGEIHGFDEPSKFDVDLFKFLHENHDVNYYFAEFDFVQASLLNDFLKTGDTDLLTKALNKWVVLQGRNNTDYFNKYLALQAYYSELPDDDKFEFIGVDAIRDADLWRDYLVELYPDTIRDSGGVDENTSTADLLSELSDIYTENPDTLFILSHVASNMEYQQDKLDREEVMFQNFSNLYKEYQLEDQKLYGFFGLFHVFQYRINGQHPLASKIRQSDLGLEGKILSINIMMNDSYMVMPSNQLPEFMRDAGAYTRMPVSADNMLFMYIVGIKDLKRMTPENHKSLIKMDKDDSPYANTIRMNKTIQLLPVTDLFEITDKGKPYTQYTLFVRNSDWAEPMD